MKLKLDFHGVIFEYEKKPMQEGRFRRLCTLAAVALYVIMVIGTTALCGVWALLAIAVVTLIVLAVSSV